MNLAKAISLAAVGFENKTDKAGEPYIMHCLRVMNNPKCNTPTRKILAMLHDTVEDEILTYNDLNAVSSHRVEPSGIIGSCFYDSIP